MSSHDSRMSAGQGAATVSATAASESANGAGAEHCELYLQEIEAVDDYWGPTFRAIYESGCQETFLALLERQIGERDAEIEKMCNHHYQGFISSVRDLLQVRADAARLNREVVDIDRDVRASADKLAAKARDLVAARRVQRNIAATIESLSLCLPVLQMFTKLNKQMAERRFHPALKTLEQLEHTFLPRIAGYRFSAQMKASIPQLREAIKEASMVELKDFLEIIRKYSPKIGEIAMRNTAVKLNLSSHIPGEPKKQSHLSPQPNPLTGEVDYEGQSESMYDTEEDLSAQDLIDFSPVYKCLHIYTVLGERDAFEKYYRNQRRQQATLTLQPPSSMHESIEGYRTYFHGIVGFFVCEDHVLNTGNGLVTRSFLDELWSTTSSKIMSTLRTHSAYCTESGFMLKIKQIMLLFSSTLQQFGFSADKMYALLQELRDHYTEVLMQKWVGRFRDIFDIDNYHPMQVNTPIEYSNLMASFPYDEAAALEEAPFPRQFPFSAMVPRVYCEVKEFILACVKFSEDLNLLSEEVDETVRKATNVLLTRTLSGCLSTLISRKNLSLLQLIQIDINTYHLEKTNSHLEKYISEITGASLEATHIARLQGSSIFKDIRAEAEEEIPSKLNSKIDEFIELANYDWLMTELQGTASPWLTDLLAFLDSVFRSFTDLPIKPAQKTCMSALQHLARSLLSMLLDENVKAVSMGLIDQINLDVLQCEQFAAKEPVQGLEEGVLLLCFSDLRQLLDLFVSWDWSTYLADYGQSTSKYIRVKPETALDILDKLKEADRKGGNVFTSMMNKKDREKKRLLDTVHKQLRALTQSSLNSAGMGNNSGQA